MNIDDLSSLGVRILHADTGDMLCLWLPPYLVCTPDREAQVKALFVRQMEKALKDEAGRRLLNESAHKRTGA